MSLYHTLVLLGILALPSPTIKILVFSTLVLPKTQLHSFQYAGDSLASHIHSRNALSTALPGAAVFVNLEGGGNIHARALSSRQFQRQKYRVCKLVSGIWVFPICFSSQAAVIETDELQPFITEVTSEELIACIRLKSNGQEYQSHFLNVPLIGDFSILHFIGIKAEFTPLSFLSPLPLTYLPGSSTYTNAICVLTLSLQSQP